MYLRPSDIYFSQDSINTHFDKRCNHRYKPIGETLDELCDGRCSISEVPTISVIQYGGKWTTADNRRLWVFRQMERLGKCEKIYVQKGHYIPDGKMTSENGGVSVRVRGSPGGIWHMKPSVKKNTNVNNSSPYIIDKNKSKPTPTPVRQDTTEYYNQINRGAKYTYERSDDIADRFSRNTRNIAPSMLTPVSHSHTYTGTTGAQSSLDGEYSSSRNNWNQADTESIRLHMPPASDMSDSRSQTARSVAANRTYNNKTYDETYSSHRDRSNHDIACCTIL